MLGKRGGQGGGGAGENRACACACACASVPSISEEGPLPHRRKTPSDNPRKVWHALGNPSPVDHTRLVRTILGPVGPSGEGGGVLQDFPGHGHSLIAIRHPPTHISLHFPLLQACKRIPTMILLLAVEQVTVSIKGHNVVLCSTVAPWIPTSSSLVCSPLHLSVRFCIFCCTAFMLYPGALHDTGLVDVWFPSHCTHLSSCVLISIHRRLLSRVFVCCPLH